MILLYFDPGVGAMIVQAIVAAVAGVLLFSKNLFYKIKLFFGLVKNQESSETIDIVDADDKNESKVGE